MYERFTDRARKVMQLANQEAQRFNHEYIGTEHILLGLVKEGSGVAANVLKNLDIDLRKIRLEVEKIVESGPNMVAMGKLPQTPRAKKAIEYAIEEAHNLNHNYVGTEHLLLGLLREREGIACNVLMNLLLDQDRVRGEVMKLLGYEGPQSQLVLTPGAAISRGIRRMGACLREHSDLTIFCTGLVATLSAAWVVVNFVEENHINVGALIGGIVYVSAVGLGYYLSRHQAENKA
jgi:ATP-dependent Clp protease ATP-binding subunit ClpA